MRGKTVLLVSAYFPPDIGGVERYVDSLARLLHQRHGWRVVVASTARTRTRKATFVDTEYARIYRIPAQARISNTPVGLRWTHFLREIIEREQVDVVNAHAPVPLLADVAARSARRLPFVLTYHTGPMRNGNVLYNLTCRTYERFVLSATARRADHIIANSKYVAESFPDLFAGKVTIIEPGVDTDLFTEGGTPDTNLVLFVASLARAAHYKGLADLIKAMAILRQERPAVRLEVVGDGNGITDYVALCRRLGLVEHVTFVGSLQRDELAVAYRRAGVLALPTHFESFGSVLAEAMSSGRPVVSTRVGGVPDLVADGVDGVLVEPGDVSALAGSIGKILADKSLATEMGRRGAQKIRSQWSWNAQAAQTCVVFEKVLGTQPGAH